MSSSATSPEDVLRGLVSIGLPDAVLAVVVRNMKDEELAIVARKAAGGLTDALRKARAELEASHKTNERLSAEFGLRDESWKKASAKKVDEWQRRLAVALGENAHGVDSAGAGADDETEARWTWLQGVACRLLLEARAPAAGSKRGTKEPAPEQDKPRLDASEAWAMAREIGDPPPPKQGRKRGRPPKQELEADYLAKIEDAVNSTLRAAGKEGFWDAKLQPAPGGGHVWSIYLKTLTPEAADVGPVVIRMQAGMGPHSRDALRAIVAGIKRHERHAQMTSSKDDALEATKELEEEREFLRKLREAVNSDANKVHGGRGSFRRAERRQYTGGRCMWEVTVQIHNEGDEKIRTYLPIGMGLYSRAALERVTGEIRREVHAICEEHEIQKDQKPKDKDDDEDEDEDEDEDDDEDEDEDEDEDDEGKQESLPGLGDT